MNKIYKMIERMDIKKERKYQLAILMMSILYMLIGLCAWLIIRTIALSSIDWMICFMGYPMFISWIRLFLYTSNHSFHTGRSE